MVPEPKYLPLSGKKVALKRAQLTVPGTEAATWVPSSSEALEEFDRAVGAGEDEGDWEYEADVANDGTMFVMSVNALRQQGSARW